MVWSICADALFASFSMDMCELIMSSLSHSPGASLGNEWSEIILSLQVIAFWVPEFLMMFLSSSDSSSSGMCLMYVDVWGPLAGSSLISIVVWPPK